MRDNFEACLAEVLRHEGGYVNDPADPGGETNMGISKRSYPRENIRGMTRARAAQIYRRDFWDRLRCDDLPAGLDLVVFDAGVNSGQDRGARWFQRALGVKEDGLVGPATIAAARATGASGVINRACDARLAFLRSRTGWRRYGKGWTARVASVRAVAHRMSAGLGETGWSAPALPLPAPEQAAAPRLSVVLIVALIAALIVVIKFGG